MYTVISQELAATVKQHSPELLPLHLDLSQQAPGHNSLQNFFAHIHKL